MSKYPVVDRCDFRPGDVIDNRYTVRKTLGEGSFGAVYLVESGGAYQSSDGGRKYALKLLRLWEIPAETRPPLMQRFEREYEIGQIDCDNLVRSLYYGTVGGNPYIVMEYCPGGDLQPLLGNANGRTTQICQDILTGLNALHERKKVHRDLKPENVLFKQNGKAALTDFGIAGDSVNRMTQRNIFGKPDQIFGTYAYMSPEQVMRSRGGATVRSTTDIFSFGVLLFQLLTNQLPFGKLESHNDLAEYQKRSKGGLWSRDALRHIDNWEQWARVIEGCLQPDIKQRLNTVQEVMSLLPQSHYRAYKRVANEGEIYLPQQQSGGSFLRILQGEESGKVYNLNELASQGSRVLTVGRHRDNAICVKSEFSSLMSRLHCTLELVSSGRWVIRDGQWRSDLRQWVNSSNGTNVNSSPVTQNGIYLRTGDIISIGEVILKFENF